MIDPKPNGPATGYTDAIGSTVSFSDTAEVPIPPERRKIDPSTIRWPEGVAKPWENKKQPPAGDTGSSESMK